MFTSDKSFIFDSDESTVFGPILAEVDGTPDIDCSDISGKGIPILPLRNMVLFPGVTLPITVGRE